MRYITSILIVILFTVSAFAQVTKVRKTSDVPSGDNRIIGWEIYNANTQEVLSSGSETHIASMMPNSNVRQMLQNLLTDYLDANNISEPDGGFIPNSTTSVVLASNVATGANVNPVSLTGLTFNYSANSRYLIWFVGRVQPGAATTGCGFQFDLSSTVTSVDVIFSHQLANTGTVTGGHSIADDTSIGVSSGFPGTSTYTITGSGLLRTGANSGTAQLRIRSETTAAVTAMAGFSLVVQKIQ